MAGTRTCRRGVRNMGRLGGESVQTYTRHQGQWKYSSGTWRHVGPLRLIASCHPGCSDVFIFYHFEIRKRLFIQEEPFFYYSYSICSLVQGMILSLRKNRTPWLLIISTASRTLSLLRFPVPLPCRAGPRQACSRPASSPFRDARGGCCRARWRCCRP